METGDVRIGGGLLPGDGLLAGEEEFQMQPGEKFGGGIGLLTGAGRDQTLAGGPQGVVALAGGGRELVVELQAPLLHAAPDGTPGPRIDFPPVTNPSRTAGQP